jgi:hypothetical protein
MPRFSRKRLSQTIAVGAAIAAAVFASDWISRAFPLRPHVLTSGVDDRDAVARVAAEVDRHLEIACREHGFTPLGPADHLLVARRLTLSLHGRIPSLAEIRELEQSTAHDRLVDFSDRLLADARFGEYLGEVLTHSIVTEQVHDLPDPYRRISFHRWLSEEINRGAAYDEIVRDIVTARGLCCENGSTNFYTAYKCDPALLAAQTARSFLGLRLDCAQCHNHPFADWKQEQFHALASYYSGMAQSNWQVFGDWQPYAYDNHNTHRRERIAPAPPIRPDLDPGAGDPRERLAGWLTHPENPYFARAIVNRLWAAMFGRGLIEPLDDLSKPERVPGVLALLAEDLLAHDFDLRHTLRVIARTRAFCRASCLDAPASTEQEEILGSYPLTRLRPDVTCASLCQAAFTTPLDDSALVANRWLSFWQNVYFLRTVGNPASAEVLDTEASLPQRLLLMNGERLEESWGLDQVGLAQQLARLCSSDTSCVEAAYLACLSRKPSAAELSHFVALLADTTGSKRLERVSDLMWCLTNASEFQWRH